MRSRTPSLPWRPARAVALLLVACLALVAGAVHAAPTADAAGVRFTYSDPAAGSVNWAGAFNNWSTSATPLTKDAAGTWSVVVPLPPGDHPYKFVVNGSQWMADPENPQVTGSDQNSFVTVGKDGKLVAAAGGGGSPSRYNPKLVVGGRFRGLYETVWNPVTRRYEFTRPELDVDLGFDIRISDVLRAYWLLNINPLAENVQDYRARLNLDRGSLLVTRPGLELLAFDGASIGTWDDPMHLVGDIGVYGHPYGYKRMGFRLNAERGGFTSELLVADNYDDRLTSNSTLYQGYRIDNFPTYTVGNDKVPGFTFEADDASAMYKAIAMLRTVRTSDPSAPTPTFALQADQRAKVSTADIGDAGRLFGFGDNNKNTYALRVRRGLPGGFSVGVLGRTDRGFGFGRLAYAEAAGDSVVKALRSLYTQESFGAGGELAWAPRPGFRAYAEALAGARRLSLVNGSKYYTFRASALAASGPTVNTAPVDSATADGDHLTTNQSVRVKVGSDWTFAQGDIGLHASFERQTQRVPLWTQPPVTPAGSLPVDHVRYRTVDFQRAQYFGATTMLDNAANTFALAWDRNWRYYLNREVRTSLGVEWTNFDYDPRTAWENQFWFPTGNLWLEYGGDLVSIDRMTVLGEQQAVRIRPRLVVPLLARRAMTFEYAGTFSGVALDKQPRYAESIFRFGFDLSRTVRFSSDTRWVKYDVPMLSLNHGYVDEFAQVAVRMAPGIQVSLGWGLNPDVLDPNTNEYAPIGRELFLNDRNVNGYTAENNSLSLAPQIADAERALRVLRRFEVQAIVHF